MSVTLRISEEEREALVRGKATEYPKYTTQILNLSNRNSQATWPHTVGSMNDLIEEFNEQYPDATYEDWERFYLEEKDGEARLQNAIEKNIAMIENMREAMEQIDEEMVAKWTRELVLYSTYQGFDIQETIFQKLSRELDVDSELGTPADESRGIDGYINGTPVSIKPGSYTGEVNIEDDIEVPILYYETFEGSDAIEFDVSELADHFSFDNDPEITLEDFVDNEDDSVE